MGILYFIYAISPLIIKFLLNIFHLPPIFNFIVFGLSIIYWIFVGSEFSKLYLSKPFSIILGNVFLIIDGIIFLFLKNNPPAFLQHFTKTVYTITYPILASVLNLIFSKPSFGENSYIIEYIAIFLFIVCFSMSFLYTYNRQKRSKYTFSKNLH